ncbi:MAG TPA: thioredoxin family protein [Methanotrichaceae archaeon]|nr:thioredoxin family protein [Methanotrichaceae archaeon]
MRWTVYSLTSACVLLFLTSGVALAGDPAPSIKWHQYDEGMALAKSENKLAVLDFGAEWCGACEEMNKTTFSDKDVISLQDRCIFIKVDVDKDDRAVDAYFGDDIKALGSTLGMSSTPIYLPKVIIADPQGKELLRTDFISAEEFVRRIKAVRP